MNSRKTLACAAFMLVMSVLFSLVYAQSERGKAELSTPNGKIVVDYGRPQLRGRDPLTWQKEEEYWRMGMNEMTTLSTPVELVFGKSKLAKGKYGVWLLKLSADRYELVFNLESSGMGMNHDKYKDVASVALKKEAESRAVEVFTIEMKDAPKGGTFALTWGTVKLSTDLQFGK